ncbi:hypothetical protein [Apilactobacillus micheneri]|uniref:hypothetical protein n=1 Tax=Apilactobacillus micheneri TaxID=1899430 RepID=UPI000D02B5B2|nr:hypothetical protein [Apilactobacillus micheneri]
MKLVHFYQRFLLDSPNKTYQFKSSDRIPHTLSIEHTNNYDGSNRPSSTDVTIHKITKEHINLIIKAFQNNTVVSLWAGWFNEDYTESDIKLVVSGTISNITPLKKTDSDISFTVKDGVDYSAEKTIKVEQRKKSKNIRLKASMPNEQSLVTNYERKARRQLSKHVGSKKYNSMAQNTNKRIAHYRNSVAKRVINYKKRVAKQKQQQQKMVYKAMSFKKNTDGKTIIMTLAKKANIKITHLKLAYNHKYIRGYVANKKPLQAITDVATDCKTPPYYRHGHMYIDELGTKYKLNLVINPTTGLIGTPQPQIDKLQKRAKPNEYSYQVSFVYRAITVGDIFKLESEELSGEVIVLSGNNSRQIGTIPTTTCVVKLLTAYKKQQKDSMNKAKARERQIAKSMRDKQSLAALNKRQKRANAKRRK